MFLQKIASQLGALVLLVIFSLQNGTGKASGYQPLISIILAFMNVLPIPALDGGHVMFLLYEMVSGRKPSDRFMEISTMIGFFILIAIVLYANGNDIVRAFAN